MTQIFQFILAMSVTASYVILAVLIIRFFLKRTPRIFSYLLWMVVLFRLLCSVSFESSLSIFNIPKYFSDQKQPPAFENTSIVSPQTIPSDFTVLEDTDTSIDFPVKNQKQNFFEVLSILWFLGLLFTFSYGLLRYFYLSYQLANAVLFSENIYETDRIRTPFILGLKNPKIYLPLGLSQIERDCVLLHERIHIKRKDYCIKFLSFFVLSVYWFHPLVWLSIHLMNKDMEISCDESVLKHAKEDIRKKYSNTLLHLSIRQSGLFMPVGFGEIHVKERIKHILKFKKVTLGISTLGFCILFLSFFVCISNSAQEASSLSAIVGTNTILQAALKKEMPSYETLQDARKYTEIRANLANLEEITDEMILENKLGYYAEEFFSFPLSNGYHINFDYFHGIYYLLELNAQKDISVSIDFQADISDTFKLVFILPDYSIQTITSDKNTYFLPEGISYIALIGCKAQGNMELFLEPQRDLKISSFSKTVEKLELTEHDFADKRISSLDEITDEMILENKIFSFVSFTLLDFSHPISNGIQRQLKYFNGIDKIYFLQAEKDTTVQIKYQPKEKENYKLVFIYPNDTVVELDENITEYFLPRGKTEIVLVGFQANGIFEIQIEPQKDVEIHKSKI